MYLNLAQKSQNWLCSKHAELQKNKARGQINSALLPEAWEDAHIVEL